jgi:hypothetical protein
MRVLIPLLLLLCAVSVAAQSTTSPTIQPEKPVVKHSKENADGKKGQTAKQNDPSTAIAPSGLPTQPQPKPQTADGNTPPNDRVYKVDVVAQPRDWLYTLYVALTGGAVIIGLITAIAIWRQMKANEVSAKAAQESAEAVMRGERAWLLTKTVQIPINPETDEPYDIDVTQSLRLTHAVHIVENFGKTPAIVIAQRVELQIGTVENMDENQPPDATVFNTEGSGYQRNYFIPQGKSVDTNPTLREERPGGFPWVCGVIRYRDVFRDKPEHETRFCLMYDPRMKGFRLAGPREYNKAT